MDTKVLAVIACPLCKGKLDYLAEQNELLCRFDRLAYPVRDGVPVMLSEEAREVSVEEME